MAYLILLTFAALLVCCFLVKRDQAQRKTWGRKTKQDRGPAGDVDQPRDKRGHERQSGPFIRVVVYDPETQERTDAALYDSSRGGAGLIAEHWLPRGRELTLLVEDQRVKMRVRDCCRKSSQWVAGCEFTEPLPDKLATALGLPRN
jgi:hypothetical protein